MKRSFLQLAAVTALAFSLTTPHFAFAEEAEEKEEAPIAQAAVPATVMSAVQAALPGAAFQSAVLEDEDGAKVYEVKVKSADGRLVEVMVRADGQFTETEEQVSEEALPKPVAGTFKKLLAAAKTEELEKKTMVVYGMKKEVGEATYELTVDANGKVVSLTVESEGDEEGEEKESSVAAADLPAAVLATVKATLPEAVVEKAMLEDEDGTKVYEVKVKTADGREVEVMVRADGGLTETEEQVKEAALPAQVAKAFAEVLPAGKVEELEKKLVVVFEAKKKGSEATYELAVDANGEVLSLESWGGNEEKD